MVRATGRRTRLVGALAVLLVLASCARIPTDGPVVEGEPVGVAPIRQLSEGPATGATPVDVVNGFVQADQDYELARLYLQPGTARSWRPSEETVVFAGYTPATSYVDAGGDVPGDVAGVSEEVVELTARLALDVVGVVDSAGRYVQQPPGTSRVVELVLRRDDDGQWRIATVPDLALLPQPDFKFAFRSYLLYFLDPTRNFLVPEQRWFPESESAPTQVVNELLTGPSPWLGPAVTTAFPSGTRLASPQVVTVDGLVVTVPLTASARQATPADRLLMRAQLLATLRSQLGVSELRMSVDGAELSLPQDGQIPRRDPDVSPSPLVLAEGVPARLEGSRLVPVPDLPALDGLGISHPGLAYGDTGLAVLAQERSQLLTLRSGADEPSEPIVVGADLTAPSFDWRGWVWTSSGASTGTVSAVLPGEPAVEVLAPWLQGRRVTSLRVSRDGTRVLVASTTADGVGVVELAGVARDQDYRPLRLTDPAPPLATGIGLAVVAEAVWVDENQVAVLGRPAEEAELRVVPVDLGGPLVDPLAPVAGASSLAAGDGVRSIVVSTADGRLLVQEGTVWVELLDARGALQPAFEG